MKYHWSQFIWSQYARLPPVHQADLTGQTIIVTGANIGLGLETIKHLARMNPANIVLAVRSVAKGEAVLDEIKQATGYSGSFKVIPVSLDEFASVSAFVTEFEKSFDRLDILISNAGIGTRNMYEKTVDGWEHGLQVNQLGGALLSLLLLPRLLETADKYGTHPRLTLTTSGAVYFSNLIEDLYETPAVLEKLSDPDYCTPKVLSKRYHDTKLLQLLFVRALTRHLPPSSGLVANAVAPGFCVTALGRHHARTLQRILFEIVFGRRASEGAKTIVWSVLAGGGPHEPVALRESLRGALTDDCKVVEPSNAVLSNAGQKVEENVWNDTIAVLSKADSRVHAIAERYLTA